MKFMYEFVRSVRARKSLFLGNLPSFSRKRREGQSSAEFIIILSIIFVILIFIIGFNSDVMSKKQSKEEVDKARIVLNTMESMGNLVFAQGLGSQTKSLISFPDEIINISIHNKTIIITNRNGQKFHRNMDFNISAGNLTSPWGRKYLYARSIDTSVIYSFYPISYDINYTLPPPPSPTNITWKIFEWIIDTKSEFDNGTYNDMETNSSGWLHLQSDENDGYYVSAINDSLSNNTKWMSITLHYIWPFNRTNLVLWWKFDNRTDLGENSTHVLDYSDYENNGTIYTAYYTDGISNKALQFNGINTYVETPDDNDLDLTSAGTILAWINMTNITTLCDNDIIINKEDICYELAVHDNVRKEYSCGYSNDPLSTYNISFYYNINLDGGIPKQCGWMDGKHIVVPKEWAQFAATYDSSSGRLMAFKNGELGANYSGSGNIKKSAQVVRVGRRSTHHSDCYFNGTIDEVMIWKRALSAEEIFDLYEYARTNVKLQVRGGNTNTSLGSYQGPGGTSDFYDDDFSNINNFSNTRYLQLKVYMDNENKSYTPYLDKIVVRFNTTV